MTFGNTKQHDFRPRLMGMIGLLLLLLLASYTYVTAQNSEQIVTQQPSTPAIVYALYHPAFHKSTQSGMARLYLQNPYDSETIVEFVFYDESGIITLVEDTIPPKGTLVLSADEVSDLPNGFYSLVVFSTQPVISVVRMQRSNGDKLALYSGIWADQSGSSQYFGPFFNAQEGKESALRLMNVGSSGAAFSASFYDLNGSVVTTFDQGGIQPAQGFSVSAAEVSGLPQGFAGWGVGASDASLVSVLRQSSVDNDELFEYHDTLDWATRQSYMPRVLKRVDEGGGARTTTLFVGNPSSDETVNLELSYVANDGTLTLTRTLTLPTTGATTIDLSSETELPDNSLWAVSLNSDREVVLSEITTYDSSSTYSSGMYGSYTYTEIFLPRVARTNEAYTVFSLQNTGSSEATVTIEYYDTEGSLVLSQPVTLSPNGWGRYNQSEMSELGSSFEGSAIITSDVDIRAWVDEYESDSTPPGTATPTATAAPSTATATPTVAPSTGTPTAAPSTGTPTATATMPPTSTPTVINPPSSKQHHLYLPAITR